MNNNKNRVRVNQNVNSTRNQSFNNGTNKNTNISMNSSQNKKINSNIKLNSNQDLSNEKDISPNINIQVQQNETQKNTNIKNTDTNKNTNIKNRSTTNTNTTNKNTTDMKNKNVKDMNENMKNDIENEDLDLSGYNNSERNNILDGERERERNQSKKYNEMNKNTEDKISGFTDFIRNYLIFLGYVQYLWDKSPLSIKIANVVSTLFLTYLFTSKVYILFLSLLFFIVSAFFLYLTNGLFCIIYILFYFIYLVQVIYRRNRYIGKPIEETSLSKNKKPYLCAGDGEGLEISPKVLSTDENGGYFSYSFWIYINALKNVEQSKNYDFTWKNYRYTEWKNVFYRGTQSEDVELMVQYPGVWLTPKMNNMVIVFRQTGYPVERFEISNIDLNKWVNIVIVSKMKSISIYVDGLFQKSFTLNQSAPLLKDYHLYVANDKNMSSEENPRRGFPGFLAELIYFNHDLSPQEVMECYKFYKVYIDKYQINMMRKNKDFSLKLIQSIDKLKKT